MGGTGAFVWDDDKYAANLHSHGIDFAAAVSFEWSRALIWQDLRRDYGEKRFVALGKIAGRIYLIVFTPRAGRLRIISLRKANEREVKRYEKEI